MTEQEKQDFIESLARTGKALKNPKNGDIRLLRTLKDEDLQKYLGNEYPSGIRSLCFILSAFFDDVFYNMVGDFPQEKTYWRDVADERGRFFLKVGEVLDELAQSLKSNNNENQFEQLSIVITAYLDTINKVNDIIKIAEDTDAS
jgi:hypothetical protein